MTFKYFFSPALQTRREPNSFTKKTKFKHKRKSYHMYMKLSTYFVMQPSLFSADFYTISQQKYFKYNKIKQNQSKDNVIIT